MSHFRIITGNKYRNPVARNHESATKNWNLSKLEPFEIGTFRNWNLSKLEPFETGTFRNWNPSKLESFETGTFRYWNSNCFKFLAFPCRKTARRPWPCLPWRT